MEITVKDAQEPASAGAPGLKDLILRSIKQNSKQYTMILALVGIWIIFALLTDGDFLLPRNLSNLFIQTVTTAIVAIAMVLVIVAGHIDLSVGSVMGFTGAVCAMSMISLQWSVIPAILLTLVVGFAVGVWHGFWVAYRKVPAFIVTLASLLGFRGLIIGLTGGQTQGIEMAPEEAGNRFKLIGQGYVPTLAPAEQGQFHDTSLYITLALIAVFVVVSLRKRKARIKYGFPVLPMHFETGRLILSSLVIAAVGSIMIFYLGVPWSVLLVLVLAVIFSFIANDTTFGRHMYAIGGNPDAARLSGINVARRTFWLFALMGTMTALGGIVYTSRLNAATTGAGQNAELDAIASAVIGGTSLMGGEGTIPGAVVGALVMASLDNGMSLMNLDVTFQYVVKGLILLLAVWVDMAQRKK